MGQTADALQVRTMPTRYEVSCLPETVDSAELWAITVDLRGHGRWSVRHNAKSLGPGGLWSFGPRDDEDATAWVEAHRFDLDTALRLAQEQAPHITVNGYSPTDALAMGARRTAGVGR